MFQLLKVVLAQTVAGNMSVFLAQIGKSHMFEHSLPLLIFESIPSSRMVTTTFITELGPRGSLLGSLCSLFSNSAAPPTAFGMIS